MAFSGAGLGLRRPMLDAFLQQVPAFVHFFEVAPENWIGVGGRLGKKFRALTEQHTFATHGLSLSLGGPDPLDIELVKRIGQFLSDHQIQDYSEHLSACSDQGHLYDLLPVPFNQEMVMHMAERIRTVQDILGRRIAVENSSYYLQLDTQLTEAEFINAVIQEADCDLLLDINNVYVNSVNHRYDALSFLKQMPAERVRYFHMAGHYYEAQDFIIDTHGAEVVDNVWGLLADAYALFGAKPTLLERDFNFLPIENPLAEVQRIESLMRASQQPAETLQVTHG
ncbi:MAG TPA: DUF692 domain-containing protein [Pseudomonadales bacterium]|nr:DUF692 domain-containing protein [Pseudomonadales bacterium]